MNDYEVELRDTIALHALAAMIGNPLKTQFGKSSVVPFSKYAYEFADQMMIERKVKHPPITQ